MKFRIPRFVFKNHFISCHRRNYVSIRYFPEFANLELNKGPWQTHMAVIYGPNWSGGHQWIRKRMKPKSYTEQMYADLHEIAKLTKLWLQNDLGLSLEQFLQESMS